MTKSALILGANGKIGTYSSRAFAAAGWNVRHYDRKTDNMAHAAEGVEVIVNGLNPPNYHNWDQLVPEITRQVIDAAEASGATVLIPGNVYNFGAEGGEWSETTPHRPNTRKGRIREEMERRYAASRAQTIVLRAGNFITSDRRDDVLGLVYLRQLSRGRVMLPGAPEAMQAFCYVPDWARAAVALSERRSALDHFEDVPFPGHSFNAGYLRAWLSARLGHELAFSRFPWWVFSLASPFWELARELSEMRYLWNTSHTLSGAKLARLLPDFESTPIGVVLESALPVEVARRNRALSESIS
jgi:nucleoside-diphosphate-sugar epimerase